MARFAGDPSFPPCTRDSGGVRRTHTQSSRGGGNVRTKPAIERRHRQAKVLLPGDHVVGMKTGKTYEIFDVARSGAWIKFEIFDGSKIRTWLRKPDFPVEVP
jgi:hypothetical protein